GVAAGFEGGCGNQEENRMYALNLCDHLCLPMNVGITLVSRQHKEFMESILSRSVTFLEFISRRRHHRTLQRLEVTSDAFPILVRGRFSAVAPIMCSHGTLKHLKMRSNAYCGKSVSSSLSRWP